MIEQDYMIYLDTMVKVRFIGVFILTILVHHWPTHGHLHPAYSQETECSPGSDEWMSSLPDWLPLRLVSLPGTHDTMALHGGEQFQCQTMSLNNQLEAGIRALDMRCRHVQNEFHMHHGFVFQQATFGDVLATCEQFLNKHPKETIVMRIKEEWIPEHNTQSFEDTLLNYLSQFAPIVWLPTNHTDPKLGEIRGKVVILQNFNSTHRQYGPNWRSDMILQDDFRLASVWELYLKWIKIKSYLHLANASLAKPSSMPLFYGNFLSGSVGVKPYFVASGHAEWGTNSSRLYFGVVNSLLVDRYEDFPRITCVFGNMFCTALFEGTNVLVYEQLLKERFYFVGIVFADFPGCGLIQAIIDVNRHNESIDT